MSRPSLVGRLIEHSDLLLLAGLIGILVLMVLPLPPMVLDLLLTFNIAFSLAILMIAIYSRNALEFSVFPSLLLVITLGRLALNVAGTRLILLHGYAGEVINTFGQFVVGGSFVVGLVIFLILVLIQFVVITNGAGRVAEVAARFTLDALPGKQMSIDADLSAGVITQAEAQARRRETQREADFYGAMDGAAKFVKGDAIASLVIMVINVVGGFGIGVLQKGMPLLEAVQQYTLLTIGEGLLGQISALLVSTATGLIVTRAASESHLGDDVAREVLIHPAALSRIGWLLAGFALMPGLPKLPFLVLAGGALALSRSLPSPGEQAPGPPPPAEPEDVTGLLDLEPVELAIGYALVELVDAAQGGDLLPRVVGVRRHCATELGIVIPPIRIRDDLGLRPGQYQIRLYGQIVGDGEAIPGRLLAMAPTPGEEIAGVKVEEPAFGLPATWIASDRREEAELRGFTLVDPASVIATHLSELLKAHAGQLTGREEVQTLLEHLRERHPRLVQEVVPSQVSLTDLRKVLQNLLRERTSIRDLRAILESLADHVAGERDPEWLTEKVREGLARAILRGHLQSGKTLPAVALSPGLEARLSQAVAPEGGLEPQELKAIIARLTAGVSEMVGRGFSPAVVCSQKIRSLVFRLLERAVPGLVVFSYEELVADVTLETVSVVGAG